MRSARLVGFFQSLVVGLVLVGGAREVNAAPVRTECVQNQRQFQIVFKGENQESILDLTNSDQQATRTPCSDCLERNQQRCEKLRGALQAVLDLSFETSKIRFSCESSGFSTYYPDEDVGLSLVIFPVSDYDLKRSYSIATIRASGAAARVENCAVLKSSVEKALAVLE